MTLEPVVRDSSDKVRQLLFIYLLLITYVVAVVFSTTDRQLLLADQGLKLPLVDLTVPLVGFYLAIPYFVLALHFNLLHNVAQHHYKLMKWRSAWDDHVPRERLNLLIFDWASLGPSGSFSPWVRSASAWLFLYSGPTVIAAVLWRFADYQSRLALVAHFAALWLDIVFVATAKNEISGTNQPATPSAGSSTLTLLRRLTALFMAPLHAAPRSKASIVWYGCAVVVIIKLLICIDVYFRSWEDSFIRRHAGVFLQDVDNSDKPNNIFGLVPRIQIDRTEPLFKPNLAQLKDMAELLGHTNWRRDFELRGMTLDLRGRSLRHLFIPMQTLPRVWAHGADLQGSDLSFAVLTGSNLVDTNLQGSRLSMVDLEGSILMDANFQGADLTNARLSGAHLDRTQMQAANLSGAVLAGAVLFDVGFQGANLDGVRLDGAIIGGVQVWAARGKLQRTALQSPFRGELLRIEAAPPTESELRRWTNTLPSAGMEEAVARYFSLVRAQPATAAQGQTAISESLYVDNQQAVKTLVSAACRQHDAFHLKPAALALLTQTMQMLDHPALEQIREQLRSPDCPEVARTAAAPVTR